MQKVRPQRKAGVRRWRHLDCVGGDVRGAELWCALQLLSFLPHAAVPLCLSLATCCPAHLLFSAAAAALRVIAAAPLCASAAPPPFAAAAAAASGFINSLVACTESECRWGGRAAGQ